MAKKSDPADKLDHEINSETWTCLECGRSMVPPSRKEIDELVEGLQSVATIAKSAGAVVKVQGLVCVGCAEKRPRARRRTMKGSVSPRGCGSASRGPSARLKAPPISISCAPAHPTRRRPGGGLVRCWGLLTAVAAPPATKALDPDPFPRHSLRHAVYAAPLHFGFESA